MNKKLIITLVITLAIIFVIVIIILSPTSSSPKFIERSVGQGDYAVDTRSPIEACNSITQEVQDSNHNLNCRLIDSKRIDSPGDQEECVDGASIAGCFACTFECK